MDQKDIKIGARYRFIEDGEEVQVVDCTWSVVYFKDSSRTDLGSDEWNRWLSVCAFLGNYELVYTVEGFEV